jgi:hypothetical protein
VSRAPAEVVQQQRDKLVEIHGQIESIEAALAKLQTRGRSLGMRPLDRRLVCLKPSSVYSRSVRLFCVFTNHLFFLRQTSRSWKGPWLFEFSS